MVCLSVCLSVTTVSPTKAAEPIVMPFGLLTRMGPRNDVLDGVQILTRLGAILRVKRGLPRTCADLSGSQYTQKSSVGGSTGMVRMPIEVY